MGPVRFFLSILGIEANPLDLAAYAWIVYGSIGFAVSLVGAFFVKFPKPTIFASGGLMTLLGGYVVGRALKLDITYVLGVIGTCAVMGALGGVVALLLPSGRHHRTVWSKWVVAWREMRTANPKLSQAAAEPFADDYKTCILPVTVN